MARQLAAARSTPAPCSGSTRTEDLETTFVSSTELAAEVTEVPATTDIHSALIAVRNPDDTVSPPEVFLVLAPGVVDAQAAVAGAGGTATVSNAPGVEGNTSGITAVVENGGDPAPLTVTVAIYDGDPSPSTAFVIESDTGVAGEYMDLQVTGADEADTLGASFYYPVGTPESATSPSLKYFDGLEWADVLSSGGVFPEKDTTDHLDGTVSGGRFTVWFDNTSTPKITELGGTFFAVAYPRPPLDFDGFLPPIGGADATGGSFESPLRAFKAGSTIPVKFLIARDGVAVLRGAHCLQATKYSDATTSAAPIDATPQGEATEGNQFFLHGKEWHFNLDTESTGLTTGIWKLVATLSDQTRHAVWIQVK